MLHYFRALIRTRRVRPMDDLVTALVRAEEGDDRLTADEILAMVILLLSAGHETTVNLIGSGTLALLQHPDELSRLRRQPELIATAVEHLVRFVSPVETATERYARRDVTIAGVRVARGELVLAVLAWRTAIRRASRTPMPSTSVGRKTGTLGSSLHYWGAARTPRSADRPRRAGPARASPAPRRGAERAALASVVLIRGLEALPVVLGRA